MAVFNRYIETYGEPHHRDPRFQGTTIILNDNVPPWVAGRRDDPLPPYDERGPYL